MLWIIKNDTSYQIVSCNMFHNIETGMHELWVTRHNGKNLKIEEDVEKEKVLLVKEAIDYAIEHNETTLRL